MRFLFFLPFILLCSSVLPARAHLGQTVEQCRQQYGEFFPVSGDVLTFKTGNLSLIVTFYDGKADAVVYRELQTDEAGNPAMMSTTEMEQLLQSNAGGRTWKKSAADSLDPTWETADGELSARYNVAKRYLAILTKTYADRAEAAQKADNSFGLKTF